MTLVEKMLHTIQKKSNSEKENIENNAKNYLKGIKSVNIRKWNFKK